MSARPPPKFVRLEEVVFWLDAATVLSDKSRLEILEDIQECAELRLEALCERAGVALKGLDDQHLMETVQRVAEGGIATASDRSAYELMTWCAYARFEEFSEPVRQRIITAFAGLDADTIKKGRQFHGKGKHPDAIGQWLDLVLQRKQAATTADLWVMLTKKPPRGYEVEGDSFGGTLYRKKPWAPICTRDQWRDRVRRARERLGRAPAK